LKVFVEVTGFFRIFRAPADTVVMTDGMSF